MCSEILDTPLDDDLHHRCSQETANRSQDRECPLAEVAASKIDMDVWDHAERGEEGGEKDHDHVPSGTLVRDGDSAFIDVQLFHQLV